MTALLVAVVALVVLAGVVVYVQAHLDELAVWLDDDHDHHDRDGER